MKQTVTPTVDGIYQHIKSHNLFKVVRGEEGVFRTPAYTNEDLLPIDHNELLTKANLSGHDAPDFAQNSALSYLPSWSSITGSRRPHKVVIVSGDSRCRRCWR